ncbi:MAG: acetolactate synthase small subunit [Proteobacteria bacterium]|nr:acetolactate synthase small subunit [Pseudomonadota bacterium]
MRHIISLLLQNEAGALSRVAALFSTRGYNIESLNVAATESPDISRLTLVTKGSEAVIDQISHQLLKLVDVVNIADMTLDDHIEAEMLLIKVVVPTQTECDLPELIESSGARVVDDSPETFTLEMTASSEELDDFIARVADCSEILTVVRSGAMAIARGHTVLGTGS